MTEIQVVVAETLEDVEIKVQEEVFTKEPTSSQLNTKDAKG